MAGQGQNNVYSASGDQPQLSRDSMVSQSTTQLPGQPTNIQGAVLSQPTNTQLGANQNTNFLNQTGESVKTMAYGAADIASGAARGAMGIAQGAAIGAANIAQGAATAVKNTLGMSPENSSNFNSNNTTLPTTDSPNNNPNTRM